MDDQELRHILEMRAAIIDRMRVLEQKQARYGTLPTPDAVELQQARQDAEILDAKLQTSQTSADLRALIPDARLVLVEAKVKALDERLGDALGFITHALEDVRALIEREHDERIAGQLARTRDTRTVWMSLFALGALVFLVLTLEVFR